MLPDAAALLAALPYAEAVLRRAEVAAAWAESSALAGFTVGGVGGHLLRAAQRTEPTLDGAAPVAPGVETAALSDWYLDNRIASPADLDEDIARFIREDGERAGARGPTAVADELAALGARLAERLPLVTTDRTVTVVRTATPVLVADYLASRVLEVVVHADDVAASAGIEPGPLPPTVADAAAAFLLRLARARSGDLAVVRAMTRADRVGDPADVLRVL